MTEDAVEPQSSPSAVDLFCGAGGLACGLAERGFDVRLGSDVWKPAARTYVANFPDHTFAELDIRDLSASDIIAASGGTAPDLIAGGPPCQGFSSAGARSADDERNTLVGWYAKLAAEVLPPVVVFENVEGFLTASGGKFVLDLLDPLVEAGYTISLEKLNVANFGVPQLRKRVIAIAALGRLPQVLVPTRSAVGSPGVWRVGGGLPPTVTAGEALAQVGDLRDDPLSSVRPPGEMELERIRALGPGQTMRDLPERLQHASWTTRANRRVRDGRPTEKRGGAPIGLRRLRADEPSKAITGAATREFVHPTLDRTLTAREAAVLQTFPTEFQFLGTKSEIATMIGNAIPPRFAAELASAVRSTLLLPQGSTDPGIATFRATNAEAMSPALSRVVNTVERRYGLAHPELDLTQG
ncbi:DNA cytosine methyltransferase [Gordonia amicalis]|uniref:DNA cytosine methyltransferase n=1 Tax=Gordonia amicalis TaxID=89053 RepID=UPI0009DFC5B1